MLPLRVALLSALLPVFAACTTAKMAEAPADPKLNPRGQAVLRYFQKLGSSPELKLVSGIFCSYGPDATIESPEKIFKATGKWPALISVDYTDFKNKWVHTKVCNQLLIDYWRAGGLAAISVHLNNPAKAEGGGLNDKGEDIANILIEGTPTHERWMRQLDDIAAGLQELQEAGVVVLWRPFHEMNGGWFWWGAQKPEIFKQAWQHMFDYYTKTKGLHNLIWVYGPNHGEKTGDYYPGNKYADIVGLDAYTDHVDPDHIKGYPEIERLGKPLGFTEYGPHGASNPPGDFDFRKLLTGISANFPRMRFVLSWDKKWNPAENKFCREYFHDPRVISRSDLPQGLAGR